MPAQKPGTSRQDFATPDLFIAAVKRKLGIEEFKVDLAASADNAKASLYYSEQDASLSQNWREWGVEGWCWLNPPFSRIEFWVRKCSRVSDTIHIALLVPASVGSNWFADYVDGNARVFFLKPRLSFDGKGPYPKDCILCLYGPGVVPGYEVWDWRSTS